MSKPKKLENDISIIDLFDLEWEQRTGCYILHAEELTLIETSASPSIPHLLKGLENENIVPSEIKYIIVTHIHLDHAGGVGLLLKSCPNASVIVHPRGERHLADPTKLILGAKAVYGEKFDALFDPIVAVPKERLISKKDGETLKIGANRTLTFYDTPGHAKHHFSIHDSHSNGMFTGDTLGILYPISITEGEECVLPSTSPNQFDPEAMLASLRKIEQLEVATIYFGHYGKSDNPNAVYQQLRYWLPKYVQVAEEVWEETLNYSFEERVSRITTKLLTLIEAEIGIEPNDQVYKYIAFDVEICAMGIADYLVKTKS
ncbi:glyoxylase-like metal-dependent hydrolase (beta-lactamase superfamily II) [Natronobacillus azotifigens]|uniref:MBL fold metallo-hydrolase n=1 Tax=Natronobacillus azotifigens TaxID=472978 RepID=A0A9J6RAR8_9BACI|nr:MBL fold metallo-hydrolase [Natronobacillus azotifigens]MCZ0702661.1 MBL fold metallo-hydrolase [Natronobacillus azotifigens]